MFVLIIYIYIYIYIYICLCVWVQASNLFFRFSVSFPALVCLAFKYIRCNMYPFLLGFLHQLIRFLHRLRRLYISVWGGVDVEISMHQSPVRSSIYCKMLYVTLIQIYRIFLIGVETWKWPLLDETCSFIVSLLEYNIFLNKLCCLTTSPPLINCPSLIHSCYMSNPFQSLLFNICYYVWTYIVPSIPD